MSGSRAATSASEGKTASQSSARYAASGAAPRPSSSSGGASAGSAGTAGKSIVSSSPSRATSSAPPAVRKRTEPRLPSRMRSSTCAAARVAWPHSSTSASGVNQRSSYSSPAGTRKAVSDRLFSAATACSRVSSGQASSGHTAAGLPAKRREVKASTW